MRKWILPRKYDFFQLNSSFARRIASRHQPALEEYANEQGLVYRLFLQRQEETSLDQLLDWLELLTRMMLRQNNLGKYTWQRNLFYQIYLSLNQSQSFVGKRYSQICEIYKLLEEQAQSQTPSHEVLKTLLERIQSLHAPSAEAAPAQLGHLPRRNGTSSLGERASFMAMQSLNPRLYTLLKKQTPLFSQENREVYRLLVEQAKRTEQTAREKTALLTALSQLSKLEVQQLWEMVERQGLFERERRLFGDRISSEQPENKLGFILNKASHSSIQRFWAALEQLNQTKRPQRVLFSSQEELTAFWKTASVEEIHSFLDQVHRQHLLSTQEESWLQHWEREYKEEYQSALTLDHRITGLTQTALETLAQSVLTMDPQQQQQTLNQALQAPDFAREYEIYLLHRYLEPASNQERQAFAEAVRPVYSLYAQVVEKLSQPSQDKIRQMEDELEEESLALFSQAASLQQLEQWQKIRFQDRPTEELSWRSFWKQGKQQQAREAFWEEWNRQPVFAASLPQELRPVLKDFIRTELLRRGLVQKDLAVMFEQLLVWEERFEETALKSALSHFSFARELSVEELQSRLSQADSRTLHGLSEYLISLVQQNLPNASVREIRLAEQLEQVYYSKTESETRQEMQQRQQEQVRQTLQEFLSQSSQESTLLLGLRQIFPSPYRNQAAYLPEYFQQLEPYDLLRWNTVVEGFSSLEAVQPLQVQFRQFLGEQGRELSQRLVESQGKVIFEYPSFYQVIQGKETGSIYSQLLFAQQDFSALCDALVKAVVFQEDSGQTVSEIPAVLEEERKAGVEETGSSTYGQPSVLEHLYRYVQQTDRQEEYEQFIQRLTQTVHQHRTEGTAKLNQYLMQQIVAEPLVWQYRSAVLDTQIIRPSFPQASVREWISNIPAAESMLLEMFTAAVKQSPALEPLRRFARQNNRQEEYQELIQRLSQTFLQSSEQELVQLPKRLGDQIAGDALIREYRNAGSQSQIEAQRSQQDLIHALTQAAATSGSLLSPEVFAEKLEQVPVLEPLRRYVDQHHRQEEYQQLVQRLTQTFTEYREEETAALTQRLASQVEQDALLQEYQNAVSQTQTETQRSQQDLIHALTHAAVTSGTLLSPEVLAEKLEQTPALEPLRRYAGENHRQEEYRQLVQRLIQTLTEYREEETAALTQRLVSQVEQDALLQGYHNAVSQSQTDRQLSQQDLIHALTQAAVTSGTLLSPEALAEKMEQIPALEPLRRYVDQHHRQEEYQQLVQRLTQTFTEYREEKTAVLTQRLAGQIEKDALLQEYRNTVSQSQSDMQLSQQDLIHALTQTAVTSGTLLSPETLAEKLEQAPALELLRWYAGENHRQEQYQQLVQRLTQTLAEYREEETAVLTQRLMGQMEKDALLQEYRNTVSHSETQLSQQDLIHALTHAAATSGSLLSPEALAEQLEQIPALEPLRRYAGENHRQEEAVKLIQRFARQIEREPLVQQYRNTVSGPEESAEQLKQSLLRDLTRIVADNSDQKLIRRLMRQLPSNTLVQQSGSEENPERQNHLSSQRSSRRDANLVLENRKTAAAEILGQREALIPQIQEKLLSITMENNQSPFPALRFSVPHRIPSIPLQNVSDSRLQLRPGRLPMLKLSGLPEGEMRITAIRPFSSQGKYDLLAYHNQYQRQEDVPVPAQVVSQQENLSALSLQYTASPSGEMQNASNGEQMAKIQQRLAASERSLMQLRKEQENLAREFFRKADESLLEQRFYRRIQEDIHLAAKRHGRE